MNASVLVETKNYSANTPVSDSCGSGSVCHAVINGLPRSCPCLCANKYVQTDPYKVDMVIV